MSTVSLNARIEKTVKDDLLDMCRRTKRSQSYYTEKALVDFLAREKEYLRRIQEGIDSKEYVDHEEVERWLASWGTENEQAPPIPIMK